MPNGQDSGIGPVPVQCGDARGGCMGERLLAELATPDIVVIAPEASVRSGLEIMRRHGISCLVVVTDGLPVGIITERNILWAAAHKSADFADRPVREFMASWRRRGVPPRPKATSSGR